MAVKGKKKSQARGSQGRRRPAQAPRPVATGRRRTPWYRTQTGILLGGIAAVVAVGLIVYAVVNTRSNAAESSRRQASLNQYTAEVRSLLQSIRSPVTEMLAVPVEGQEPLPEDFFSEAQTWVNDLQAASTEAQGIPPASGQQEAQQLFSEAVLLYADSARTFSDAALVNETSQKPILLRAAAQQQHAATIWQVGVSLLDSARSEADMAPSLIGSPADFSAGAQPTPTPEGDKDAGGGGGDDDKGGGGGDDDKGGGGGDDDKDGDGGDDEGGGGDKDGGGGNAEGDRGKDDKRGGD